MSNVQSVFELAWAGKHTEAIEQATRLLAARGLEIPEHLQLLDLRSESHLARGDLARAREDSAEMATLAGKARRPGLRALALCRDAMVRMRGGDLKAALKSSEAALEAAKRSGDDAVLALAWFRVAEAQFRMSTLSSHAARSSREAARRYGALGDIAGRGRALWALGVALNEMGKARESTVALRESLALARRSGDLYGMGNALNLLTFHEADLAAILRLRRQCRTAFEAAGYVERQATALANLGVLYARMGLWRRARRIIFEALDLSHGSGNRGLEWTGTFVLSKIEIETGNLEPARAAADRALEMVGRAENPVVEGFMPQMMGEIAMASGDMSAAAGHFRRATERLGAMKDNPVEAIALAYLSQALLAIGDVAGALEASARAARLHREVHYIPFAGAEGGDHIWWAHYEALKANGRIDEARKALGIAYGLVVDGISSMSDEGLRRSFLCHTSWHRKIVLAWIEESGRMKLGTRKQTAHLAGKANLREPFERLADTGLRLNEIRGVPELQDFLIEEATELCGAERVLLVLERDGGRALAGSLVPRGESAGALLSEISGEIEGVRRTRAASLLHGPRGAARLRQRSRIVAPLIAQHELIGYLYADIDGAFGRFNDSDRDLLGMLASQGAVALANARWSEGLEAQVEQRTLELKQSNASLAQRANELAIINSVQEGLASKLDIEAIFALVGNQIREIFKADTTYIGIHDVPANEIAFPYYVDRGETPGTVVALNRRRPYGKGLTERIIDSGKPLLFRGIEEQAGGFVVVSPGAKEDLNQSFVGVPIFRAGKASGAVSVQSYQRNAYGPDDVRLLATLANSMGVALENARLFDETQKLLRETERRNAELAVINSIQQGLAAELDLQSIIELVGEKLREVFHADVTGIGLYDRAKDRIVTPYLFDHGERYFPEPRSRGGISGHVLETRKPVVIHTQQELARVMKETGSTQSLGSDVPDGSFVYAPLVSGDAATGLIVIGKLAEHAFSASDVSLITTVAASLSVALQNAQSFQAERQRNAELAVINSIQQGMAGSLDFQGIVDLVGDKLREVLHTHDMGIRWYDHEAGLTHYLYEVEHGRRLDWKPMPINPTGTHARIIESRQPLIYRNAADMAAVGIVAWPGTDQSKSMVMVPILGGDRVLGSILLESFEREDAFGESEVRLLQTVAASMGVALENARLFDETQRLYKESEQRAAELAIINSVQQALAAELNIQGIYDAVGDKIREIFNQADLGIRIFDEDQRRVHMAYLTENGKRLTIGPQPLNDKGFSAHIRRTGQTLVVNEDMPGNIVKYGSAVTPGTDMEKSSLFVPLVTGGKVRGVLHMMDMQREHAFSESDVRLLETLAGSMSVALENARLFDETQRLYKESEQRAAELAVINSIQQGIAAELDFNAIVELVGDKLREVFRGADLGIRLIDRKTDLVHFVYETEHGKRLQIAPIRLRRESRVTQAVLARESVVLNTRAAMKEWGLRQIEGTAASLAFMAVPIIGADGVIGTIAMEDYETEDAFGEAQVRLLTTVAASMGVALENARLFEERQRRAKETAALAEVGRDISSTLELATVMDRIARHAKDLLGADNSAIFLPDEGGSPYRAIVAIGEVADAILNTVVEPGSGIIGSILQQGRAEFVNDTGGDPRAIQIAGTDKKDKERLMVAPLLAGDAVKGAMALPRRTGRGS